MEKEFYSLRKEGYALAGGLTDLAQRASVYFHMYEDSGRRNVFPLIAAHGALWASGYFRRGMILGSIFSSQYFLNPALRAERLKSLRIFADEFRDINRKVCAESYAIYHYSKAYFTHPFCQQLIPLNFLSILHECHLSNAQNTEFSQSKRQELFRAFFLWEQHNIVAPQVEDAVAAFDWPLIKYLAMKPNVEFSYFGLINGLKFRAFHSKEERIANGLLAYERAEMVGLDVVERELKYYRVMPKSFFNNTNHYFQNIRESNVSNVYA